MGALLERLIVLSVVILLLVCQPRVYAAIWTYHYTARDTLPDHPVSSLAHSSRQDEVFCKPFLFGRS